jgi:hypothetical protein
MAANIAGLPPIQMLPSQITSDDLFAHSKDKACGSVNRNSIGLFLGQSVHYFFSR